MDLRHCILEGGKVERGGGVGAMCTVVTGDVGYYLLRILLNVNKFIVNLAIQHTVHNTIQYNTST